MCPPVHSSCTHSSTWTDSDKHRASDDHNADTSDPYVFHCVKFGVNNFPDRLNMEITVITSRDLNKKCRENTIFF